MDNLKSKIKPMRKPLQPSKPAKNTPPPVNWETKYYEVVEHFDDDDLELIDSALMDDDSEEFLEEFDSKYERITSSRISFKLIQKIKSLIPNDVDDFDIETLIDRDGYREGLEISFNVLKSAEEFEKEMHRYNDRFNQYEIDMAQYKKLLDQYEKLIQENKIQKLKEKLDKLENKMHL